MAKRVYIMPVGFFMDAKGVPTLGCFLSMVDHTLPRACGAIKPVGGAIEPGESDVDALRREIKEELGPFLERARIPGSRKGFLGFKSETPEGWCRVGETEDFVLFSVIVDGGVVATRDFLSSLRESAGLVLTHNAIEKLYPSQVWTFPAMRDMVLDFVGRCCWRQPSGSSFYSKTA